MLKRLERRWLIAAVLLIPLIYSCASSSDPQVGASEALPGLDGNIAKLRCEIFGKAFFQKQSGDSLLLYVEMGREDTIAALAKQLPKDFKRDEGDLAGGFYETFFENNEISISITNDQKCTTLTLVSVVRRNE